VSTGINGVVMSRGQVIVLETPAPIVDMWEQLGLCQRICTGIYRGDLAGLPACPVPYEKPPAGRCVMDSPPAASLEQAAMIKTKPPKVRYASVPRPLGPGIRPQWHESPLIRVRFNATGDYHGVYHFTDGEEQNIPIVAAIKMKYDVSRINRHGEALVEILEEIPSEWRLFEVQMRVFMKANPGAPSDAAGFPDFVSVMQRAQHAA
jgi:hypothetical protein